jgi:hypothetical protein
LGNSRIKKSKSESHVGPPLPIQFRRDLPFWPLTKPDTGAATVLIDEHHASGFQGPASTSARPTGQVIKDVQSWVRHPVIRSMAATVDGIVEGNGAVFEAKFMLPWSFS